MILAQALEELTSSFEDAGIGKQATLTVEGDGQTRNVMLIVADISQLTRG